MHAASPSCNADHSGTELAPPARLATRPLGAVAAALCGLALIILNGSAPAAHAQPAPRDQLDAEVAYLPDSSQLLLFWSEDRGAGMRIFARRLHANGRPVGSATSGEWEATREGPQGSTSGRGDQRWPSAIAGMLVYSEKRPGTADYDIYGQRLFENGRPSGLPMMVAGGPGNQMFPSVVSAERGLGEEYLIVWSEDNRDAGDVMGIRVDYALRRSRGPAFPVAQGPGTAEDPTVSPDPSGGGGYLVHFTDDRNGSRDIYGTRLVESGLPRGGPTGGHFSVVEGPDQDSTPRLVSGLERQGRRQEAYHLLLWTREDVMEGANVMAQRLAANGLPSGRPFVLAGGAGEQARPAAVAILGDPDARLSRDASDSFFVVWSADPLANFDIFGSNVGLQGTRRGAPTVLARD